MFMFKIKLTTVDYIYNVNDKNRNYPGKIKISMLCQKNKKMSIVHNAVLEIDDINQNPRNNVMLN